MDTAALLCHDLLAQCEQVGAFTLALHRVACMYAWEDLEPYAAEAWAQLSEDRGLMWDEIREFVREPWLD